MPPVDQHKTSLPPVKQDYPGSTTAGPAGERVDEGSASGPAVVLPQPPSVERLAAFSAGVEALLKSFPQPADKSAPLTLTEDQFVRFNEGLAKHASRFLNTSIPVPPNGPGARHYMVMEKLLEAGYCLDMLIQPNGEKQLDIVSVTTGLAGKPRTYDTAGLLSDLAKQGFAPNVPAVQESYYMPENVRVLYPPKVDGNTPLPFGRSHVLPSGKNLVLIDRARIEGSKAGYDQVGAKFDLNDAVEGVLRNEFSDKIFRQMTAAHELKEPLNFRLVTPDGRTGSGTASVIELNEAFSDLCSLSVEGVAFKEVNRVLHLADSIPTYRLSGSLMKTALFCPSPGLKAALMQGPAQILESDGTLHLAPLGEKMAESREFRDAVLKDVRKVYIAALQSALQQQ